ncbi:ChrR family anti-sigma-E factor [Azospirillum thermophilum]|uniref:Transcriptional regulator n=1 Tax=Azospirillum thermophilum TaxID=2202148 RepID=A0A2S2CZM8_9PROT|nr:ChrR family anti-sigma-E factor [Azospirillum thermophilum]AWK89959.1 transcriptional regulator [Azospirillum thermophilum]
MMPKHHPSDALLVAYGSGSLGEALSLAVATHLARCPLCRAAAAEIDALGGALLEELAPEPLAADALSSLFARIDAPDGWMRRDAAPVRLPAPNPCRALDGAALLPEPLRSYVGPGMDQRWQRIAPGVRRIEVMPRTARGGTAHLLRIAPGTALPHHGHGGTELTLVFAGSYADELGRYTAGDIAEADGETRHQPIADSHEDCICLIATDAPLRFTGLVGRLMQPFIGL